MTQTALKLCIPGPGSRWNDSQLEAVNPCLERMDALERIRWALEYLPGKPLLTSSFGAQSAVMLHLMAGLDRTMPVVLIDTGYLFPETYRFVDELQERIGFQLHIYRPRLSPTWQEVKYGKLWEKGEEGIRRYNRINKVEPMERALEELEISTWFSGLRRTQSDTRKNLRVLQRHGKAIKVYPIADWTDRDIHRYLKAHDLPYHPLWDQGYVSIGDVHTSRPLTAGMDEQDTRFFGLLRECGLHEPDKFAANG